MGLNIIIILLGCVIILLALYLMFKERSEGEDELSSQLFFHEKPLQAETKEEVVKLRNEVMELKLEIEGLSELLQAAGQQAVVVEEAPETEYRFDQMLNYNRFTQKNQTIIDLYQSGKTTEDIARKLKKSVREVEMVIKLIK